jgi:hypothetical protein
MAHSIKPPNPIQLDPDKPTVFLAGSIEGGVAENWQTDFEHAVLDQEIVILNPRRDEWDTTWEQKAENPQFREQVEWELEGQERADIIALYFAPDTRSPISLLELGLSANSGKMMVCCPEGFWKKGNVDIVCQRYGIETASALSELIDLVRKRIKAHASRRSP